MNSALKILAIFIVLYYFTSPKIALVVSTIASLALVVDKPSTNIQPVSAESAEAAALVAALGAPAFALGIDQTDRREKLAKRYINNAVTAQNASKIYDDLYLHKFDNKAQLLLDLLYTTNPEWLTNKLHDVEDRFAFRRRAMSLMKLFFPQILKEKPNPTNFGEVYKNMRAGRLMKQHPAMKSRMMDEQNVVRVYMNAFARDYAQLNAVTRCSNTYNTADWTSTWMKALGQNIRDRVSNLVADKDNYDPDVIEQGNALVETNLCDGIIDVFDNFIRKQPADIRANRDDMLAIMTYDLLVYLYYKTSDVRVKRKLRAKNVPVPMMRMRAFMGRLKGLSPTDAGMGDFPIFEHRFEFDGQVYYIDGSKREATDVEKIMSA